MAAAPYPAYKTFTVRAAAAVCPSATPAAASRKLLPETAAES
jgi:hypothetical protein